MTENQKGWLAALLSPVFLGLAPFLGKLALVGGADPFTVAALRTGLVALMLWTVYGIFWRQYIYIYPAGLIACITIGATNGIGSLFYYSGLARLDASVAQLLNATYLIFVVILTRFGGAKVGWKTISRVIISLFGVAFITGGVVGDASWLGIGLMLGNALLFAGTMVMSQRVLYEMPAQTVTLYVMSAMATVVIIARLIYNISWIPLTPNTSLTLVALAITTALSRLMLFAGVKVIGGVKTALLAIAEIAVAVALAYVFLDDRLTAMQWIGVAALVGSLFIPMEEVVVPHGVSMGLPLPSIIGLRYQQMAFTKAFLKNQDDKKITTQEIRSMGHIFGQDESISTQEMESLMKMLGEDIPGKKDR